MTSMAQNLANQGINVGLFDFEYMQIAKANGKKRPADRAQNCLLTLTNAQRIRQSLTHIYWR